jgi:hypothetical protein
VTWCGGVDARQGGSVGGGGKGLAGRAQPLAVADAESGTTTRRCGG